MRILAVLLAAALSLALAGCASHARPLAVSQPPAALSVPQTQVALPPEQPLDPDALADAQPPAPAVRAATPPVPAPLPATPAVTAPVRRPAPSVAAQPAPPPIERPAIQAIVPAQEQKKLKDSADARKKEVRATLARMAGRRLSAGDQDLMKRIQFFLTQSDDAERRGDMSQADAFAQRAQDLAKGWQ
jgi:hypothetical protein